MKLKPHFKQIIIITIILNAKLVWKIVTCFLVCRNVFSKIENQVVELIIIETW